VLVAPVGVIAFAPFKAGLLPRDMVIRNYLPCGFALALSAFLAFLTARQYFR